MSQQILFLFFFVVHFGVSQIVVIVTNFDKMLIILQH